MVTLQHVQRCHLCARHSNQVAQRDIPTNFRVALEDDTFLAGGISKLSLELRPATASTVGGMGEPAEAA